MATSSPTSQGQGEAADPTFRNYSSDSASNYAKYRQSYPPALISAVVAAHINNGTGQLGTLVDVGCGPGIATRSLAPYFQHAYGLDPGMSMIEAATSLGGITKSNEDIVYIVASAEEIDAKLMNLDVAEGSVDLITAATAAHWFDLPKFYTAACKMLRPSGTIAMWCSGSWYIDKRYVRNGDAVQAHLDKIELEVLKPYELPGNRMCRELYANINLPWTSRVEGFDKNSYVRQTWNEGGEIETDLEGGWMRGLNNTWEQAKKGLGTASMVTRWREAHKQQLARGEVEDCVDAAIRELEALVNGSKTTEQEGYLVIMPGGSSTGMVTFKKS